MAGGVAAMFVPGLNIIAAGAIAGALTSGGLTAFSQKAQNGSVNWWSVLGNTAIGAVTGAAGGGAATWTKSILAGAPAGRAAAAMAVSAGVNGSFGAGVGAAGYLTQSGGRINNGWEFAGKVTGGGLAGAIGGLAGPAGGSLAMRMGSTSTGSLASGLTVAATGGASATGSMLEDIVAGDAVDPGKAGLTGLFGIAGALVPVPGQTGVNTLRQMPDFGVRTWGGMVNINKPNTQGLWGGGLAGGVVGYGSDSLQNALQGALQDIPGS